MQVGIGFKRADTGGALQLPQNFCLLTEIGKETHVKQQKKNLLSDYVLYLRTPPCFVLFLFFFRKTALRSATAEIHEGNTIETSLGTD